MKAYIFALRTLSGLILHSPGYRAIINNRLPFIKDCTVLIVIEKLQLTHFMLTNEMTLNPQVALQCGATFLN